MRTSPPCLIVSLDTPVPPTNSRAAPRAPSLKVGKRIMGSQDQLRMMLAAGESLRDLGRWPVSPSMILPRP